MRHDLDGIIDRIAMPDGVNLNANQLLGLPPGTVPVLGTGPLPALRQTNGERTSAGRASLLWNATDQLTLEASYLNQNVQADGVNTEVAGVGDLKNNFVHAQPV